MEKYHKLWNVFVLGPLLLAPLFAVEFPRVLAYLPLFSTVAGLLILFFSKQKIELSSKLFLFIFGLLAFLFLHSLLLAEFEEDSLERIGKLALILPFGALFLCILKSGSHYTSENFLKWIYVSCALGACFVCYEIFTNASIYKIIRPDVQEGSYTLSVFNRGALTITFLAFTAFSLTRTKQNKLLLLMLVPVFLMLMIVESQSSQIALLTAAFLYFLYPISKKYIWQTMVALIVLAMAVTPCIVPWLFSHLPNNIYDYHLLQQSFVGHRFEIWNFIIKQVFESPIYGHGLEFTKNFTGFETDERFLHTNQVLHPHNFIVQLWIELGAIGVGIFAVLLGLFFKFIYGLEDLFLKRACLTMSLTVLLVACFSYGMWQSWWLGLLFIVAGIFCASRDIVKTT